MPAAVLAAAAILVLPLLALGQTDWKPQDGPLLTRWARDVRPDRVHPEYPRPQMVRPDWQNLNGLWDYAIQPKDAARPTRWDGRILVPFPVESALSGAMKRIDETQRLWYRRTCAVPAGWAGRRVLLHFGAVDWETTVWVNGREIGTHRGGYDPFSFDITDALNRTGEQEIVLAVWDPTDAGTQPRGKQVRKPETIWYTPTSGIWQTVWLEPVAAAHLAGLRITPDVDRSSVRVEGAVAGGPAKASFEVVVSADGREVARGRGDGPVEVKIEKPRLWSPESPFLYDLRVALLVDGKPVDEVASYFGLRKITLGKDAQGTPRLFLNNQPVFMYGPLDQGFWPDGLYAAPTDEALRYDVEMMRKLGCNMVRKHVKVEPARWYHWCDRLGLMVWQDMPSGDRWPTDGKPEIVRSKESAEHYERELERMIEAFGNHPSIVVWIPFNESWGQYDTRGVVERVRRYDPTRLVDAASGWNDLKVGDIVDIHSYPGPASPTPEPVRAAVLGEFGGLGWPVKGHLWQEDRNWGYRRFESGAELTEAYVALMDSLRSLIHDPGLCAAVYTQWTDVEIEVNGLLTYDRAVLKVDAERVAAAHRRLYGPPPVVKVVVPTSQAQGLMWRYTTEKPGDNWFATDFEDAAWREGPGPFGTKGTPGLEPRTEWKGTDIWLRRSFELTELPANPQFRLYHDEDCEVYVNGRLLATAHDYTTSYVLVPLRERAPLKVGRNVLAVHCRQTVGGQGIDVGLVDVKEAGAK